MISSPLSSQSTSPMAGTARRLMLLGMGRREEQGAQSLELGAWRSMWHRTELGDAGGDQPHAVIMIGFAWWTPTCSDPPLAGPCAHALGSPRPSPPHHTQVPSPGQSVYSACKMALGGYYTSLKYEIADTNVGVTMCFPGEGWVCGSACARAFAGLPAVSNAESCANPAL